MFFLQAEDGIRDFCLSRGLGDVYKRQVPDVLRLLGLKRKRWPVVFEQLRVMELAALEVMRAAVR